MNRKLLVTRPKHDITTHYLFHWAGRIIELAKEKGIGVLDLSRKRANSKETTSMLKKRDPRLAFFNGHGNEGCITGDDNKILIKAGKNEELLKSKLVYAVSCRSGKVLGPKSIKAGALAYLGYDKDFVFLRDEDKVRKPLSDDTAKLFLTPSNQVIVSLIKGHSVRDSYKRSQKLFRKNIFEAASSESSNSYLAPYLLWDMNHQVCLGNGNATF